MYLNGVIYMKKKNPKINIELQEDLEYYGRPVKNMKKYVYVVGVVVLLLGSLIISPVFTIKEIVVEGSEKYDVSHISQLISLSKGDNLILFQKSKAEKILEQDPYIIDADLSIELPNTMKISIDERKVRGYVHYMGDYLYIDEDGRVLETKNTYYEPLPEVIGLKFDYFRLGEVLPVENENALNIVLQMSQMMKKYDLLNMVLEIDVSNVQEIYIYVNEVEFLLGNMNDIDQKIRVMAEVIKNIAPEDRGSLDLTDLNKPIIFKYLT